MKKKDFIIVKAENIDSALIKATNYFKTNVDNCDYTIISKGNEIKVKIWLKDKRIKNNEEIHQLTIEEKIENLDGYFKIDYIDGFAYLTVYSPKGIKVNLYILKMLLIELIF